MSFKGNSKVNQILNLLFDYRCKLYSMSCYLTLPFCSVLFYSLFQEMSVLFNSSFVGLQDMAMAGVEAIPGRF